MRDILFTVMLGGAALFTAYVFLATDAGALVALGPSGLVSMLVLWLTFHEKRRSFLEGR